MQAAFFYGRLTRTRGPQNQSKTLKRLNSHPAALPPQYGPCLPPHPKSPPLYCQTA